MNYKEKDAQSIGFIMRSMEITAHKNTSKKSLRVTRRKLAQQALRNNLN
jgi:hypothetical protein